MVRIPDTWIFKGLPWKLTNTYQYVTLRYLLLFNKMYGLENKL